MNGAIYINGILTRSSGKELMQFRLKNRILLYLDEWFLEPDEGIDWFDLRGIAPDPDAIKAAVKNALERDDEVTSVESVEIIAVDSVEKSAEYNKPLRTGIISASVNTVYGNIEVTA